MHNIMLDLETLSTRPGGFIGAIGAVAFDSSGLGSEFYTVIRNPEGNGEVDADTVFWWLNQSEAARAALLDDRHLCPSLRQALKNFAEWVTALGVKFVWGNGAAFDNVLMAEAYRRAGLERPWPFWGDMCYRTIKNLHGRSAELGGPAPHHALADAKRQAEHLLVMDGRVGGLIP